MHVSAAVGRAGGERATRRPFFRSCGRLNCDENISYITTPLQAITAAFVNRGKERGSAPSSHPLCPLQRTIHISSETGLHHGTFLSSF